ncbi:hypothetical protein JX265_007558 [Neoarthrinium moseri]|uniref:AMP-activated protein kinase glycogen-binding domain-containing protein n=1 Tax=Neoarthrinium moseri TaxID=1658444 RepID=A0A9Q0APL2_9PEZI|nr:hypothetical protein JX265_007558 [Neoarthrinium moseri]
MPQRQITITYQRPGTHPPIFVAGTFTDPAWKPQEMTHIVDEHGENKFESTVSVQEGAEVLYKFRIGHGDWWACDEGVDTVSDGQGNVNNVMRIESAGSDDQDFDDVYDDDVEEPGCPLFAYESVGSQEAYPLSSQGKPFKGGRSLAPDDLSPFSAQRNPSMGSGNRDVDHNDPRVEVFPNRDRRSIVEALLQLQNIMPEDESSLDIPPPSPVVSSGSYVLTSGGPQAESKRLSVPRTSLGSMNSERSQASLESIQEAAEDDSARQHQNGSAIYEDSASKGGIPTVKLETPPGEGPDVSLSSGSSKDDEPDSQLRRRNIKDPHERPVSAASMNSLHEVSRGGNWLQSFLRVIFVDWIGGFFSNLFFGNKPKA